MNRNVVISGSSGFVGQHLVPYLKEQKHIVSSLNLRNPVTTGDLDQADVVIHLAGKAHDHKGTATDNDYFEINTELTKVFFNAFLNSKAKVFIHFSSVAAITDEKIDGILTEQHTPDPQNAYGKSKLAAEVFLLNQLLPEDKKVIILRPAMIHGPGDKGNLTFLYNIIEKGIPYPLAAFENNRSFLSIENLCFVVDRILQHENYIDSGIYNMVDDDPVSTNRLVAIINKVLNKKNRTLHVPRFVIKTIASLGDMLSLPLNTKRLAKLTGNYIVSNQKIKQSLGIRKLPLTAEEGLTKTIDSFKIK